jgi:tripartite-type tricarboxylate transporter receptor subunit TctC
MKRKIVFGFLLMGMTLYCFAGGQGDAKTAGASGDNYPSKPIQFVLGANPGGGTDGVLRTMLKYLPQQIGGDVIITYMNGGSGSVATRFVKDSVPDGYTLSTNSDNTIMGYLTGLTEYSMEIFDYVLVPTVLDTSVIVSNKFNTFAEMEKYAMANPGKLRIGIETGSSNMTWACAWALVRNLEVTFIDVANVANQVASLAGDHIDAVQSPYNALMDYVKTGQFKMIALPNPKRHPELPNVPTMMELGVDVAIARYYYIGFPKGTPKTVADKWERAMKVVSENPQYIADLAKLAIVPNSMNLADSEKFIEQAAKIMEQGVKYIADYEKKYGKF